MISLTKENKTTAVSLTNEFKHGKAVVISDIAAKTFNDPIFADNATLIKNFTFNQLGDQAVSLEAKNTVALTNENKT